MEPQRLQRSVARRAQERRRRAAQRRRRRALALAAAALVVAAVVVAVASAGSGSERRSGNGSGGAPLSGPSSGTHTRHGAAAGSGAGAGSAAAGSARHGSAAGGHGSTAAVLGPATGHPGTRSVPILMYHVIAPPIPGAPYPGLYVPEPEFAAQMQALKDAGWHAVTLDQLRAYWTRGARLPPGRPIVITFDNGYRSQYVAALPVLRRLGWVADENIQLTGLPPSQGGLTDAQVRGLIAAGWELDTQGISHADLIALDASALHDQVATARAILRRRYGVPVNWFCYPSGHYDARVIDAVKAAGYIGSTTVIPGWASPGTDPYTLPRLRVLGGTTPSELLAQIDSARSAGPPPPSYG